jgi:hypothetical protein
MPKMMALTELVGRGGAIVVDLLARANSSLALGDGALAGTPNTGTLTKTIAIGDAALGTNDLSGGTGDLVAVGWNAMILATSAATRNVAIGGTTMRRVASVDNVAVGTNAGNLVTTGSGNNTFIGSNAGSALTTGAYNTIIGSSAGGTLTTQIQNVFIGATTANTSTSSNAVAIGVGAQTNDNGVAVGHIAQSTATNAVAIGYGASATGAGSVAIGRDSTNVSATTTVVNEIRLGTASHTVKIPGSVNTLTVGDAAPQITLNVAAVSKAVAWADAQSNMGMTAAVNANPTGLNNVYIGPSAGDTATSGDACVLIGYQARGQAAGSTSATAVGSGAKAHSNAVAVGRVATALQSSTVAIGETATVNAGCTYGVAVGPAAGVTAGYGTALGRNAKANHAGGVAIGADNAGTGSITTAINDFVLGTALHSVKVPGTLTIGTQSTGWSVTAGYTVDKTFNPENCTVTELARVVGALVDALKSYGVLGA